MSDNARPDAAKGVTKDAHADETGGANALTAETVPGAPETQSDGNTDVFPRQYVEELRKESAGYRDRANALAKRLHRQLVAATERLENPDDLPFDAEHIDDADKLSTAIDSLLAERPYFAKRKVSGDAGQGPRGGNASAPSNFSDLLRPTH